MFRSHTHFPQSVLKLLLVFMYSEDPTDLWLLCTLGSQRGGDLLLDVASSASSKGDKKEV